jgi:phage terminase large subunit-like protein
LYRGFVGGRGAGKTFIGAYDLLRRAKPRRLYGAYAPSYKMLQDAAFRTFLDLGQSLMFIGDVNKADLRVTLGNGAEVLFRSLDNPESARGPSLSGAWIDEASLVPAEAYEIVIGCLREAGEQGWLSATFTPKGQQHWTYRVFGKHGPNTELFAARTLDNPFLPRGFYEAVRSQYGSSLALQELDGQFIGDIEGALWKRATVDAWRVREAPALHRITVAVDPAVTSGQDADETGIVVAGAVGSGLSGQYYVLEDASRRASPDAWMRRALVAYDQHKADRVVAEVNNGGELVETILRTISPTAAYRAVSASRGKRTRAEPIAALYEQGRVHHVGYFAELEDQLCTWVPGDASPDRLDALVWAITDLMGGGGSGIYL